MQTRQLFVLDMGEYNSSSTKKARLNSVLTTLLGDPLLADVPKNPTLADVDTLISLQLGSAMRISILKLDGTSFDVTMMNSATVKDLKLAIKKKVNDMEQSSMGHRHISWRHVWANYCLSHHNSKLLEDDDTLQNFAKLPAELRYSVLFQLICNISSSVVLSDTV
ncbi:hypothetical protein Lal_00029119 [Lupinus albus]|nr:hypothetical protein Lal_00029119 [Lupinus albus]